MLVVPIDFYGNTVYNETIEKNRTAHQGRKDEIKMNKPQMKEFMKTLAIRSQGNPTEYVALVKGNNGVVFPASDKERYKHYRNEGYVHVMSVLDGDVLELF